METINRDSFILYRSFYESIKDLPKDRAYKLFIAICEYGLNHNEIELDNICKSMFILIKPQIEANYKKWLNASKGGAPKGTINNPKGKNQFSKKEDNLEDNLEDNNRITIGKINENDINENVINVNTNETEIIDTLHTEDVALYQLPLNIKGKFKSIYQSDINYYNELYPNVNICQEFRNMIGWLNSNISKRKTIRGIDKFINGWLSRKQDSPSNNIQTEDNKFSVSNILKM